MGGRLRLGGAGFSRPGLMRTARAAGSAPVDGRGSRSNQPATWARARPDTSTAPATPTTTRVMIAPRSPSKPGQRRGDKRPAVAAALAGRGHGVQIRVYRIALVGDHGGEGQKDEEDDGETQQPQIGHFRLLLHAAQDKEDADAAGDERQGDAANAQSQCGQTGQPLGELPLIR